MAINTQLFPTEHTQCQFWYYIAILQANTINLIYYTIVWGKNYIFNINLFENKQIAPYFDFILRMRIQAQVPCVPTGEFVTMRSLASIWYQYNYVYWGVLRKFIFLVLAHGLVHFYFTTSHIILILKECIIKGRFF